MSSSSSSSRKDHDNTTIDEGEGGYYGRTLDGRRSRPPITGLKDYLRPLLDKLTSTGVSRSLQENTIEGIVERNIFGEGFDRGEFWERPGFPNVRTYKSWRAADPEGKDPTSFVSVLKEAKKAGGEWRTAQAAERVEMAYALLQHHAPDFVESLVDVALDSKNDFAKLQAATAGLDRVSERTAPKGGASVNIVGLESAINKIYGAKGETAEEVDE